MINKEEYEKDLNNLVWLEYREDEKLPPHEPESKGNNLG